MTIVSAVFSPASCLMNRIGDREPHRPSADPDAQEAESRDHAQPDLRGWAETVTAGPGVAAGERARHAAGGAAAEATSPTPLDDLLERCLEEFLPAAPVPTPEVLRRFLPQVALETQRFLLAELIKLDMACRAERLAGGDWSTSFPRIEDYLPAFSDLMSPAEVPLDLVMEEIQLRKEAGRAVEAEPMARRFPEHGATIAQLLGGQLGAKAEATAALTCRSRAPEFQVGQQVDDFVIVQTLGSGAFANVYLARQLSMSRLVALKVSRGTGDEPQALAQFDHPNIVRVFDQRQLDSPPAHLLYMQFLPGGTLADVVARVKHTPAHLRSGALLLESIDRALLKTAQAVPERSSSREALASMSWPMAVAWIGIQLSRALQAAHRQGVMHRDVKPANVLLSADGVPKLADFNVSFAGSAGRAGAASSFGGSIAYMAPEHLRAISATSPGAADEVGPRADLYSLGILLWELWQGQRPFALSQPPRCWSDAIAEQLRARSKIEAPASPSEDALSRLLEQVLRRTLAVACEDRLASGAELETRLMLARHPQAARLFDPEPNSLAGWLGRRSPWLVASAVILVPNAIAGVYGWVYNYKDTLGDLFDRVDGLEATFKTLSTCVNAIAFPLAVALILSFTRRVVVGLKATAGGRAAVPEDLDAALDLAHRAAVIGGLMWCLAAVVYPSVLWASFAEFSRREVGHFVLSHVICGGVAAIYPFFGLSVYASAVLYPRMVRPTLRDPGFDARVASVVRRCERYLLLACLVPLLGATLLLISDEQAKDVMLLAIAATGLGLLAAFSAYRFILRQFSGMSPVLSARSEPGVATFES